MATPIKPEPCPKCGGTGHNNALTALIAMVRELNPPASGTGVNMFGRASVLQFNADSCQHCRAPYGHFISCPTINRASAEAHSTVQSELSPEDVLRIAGLGIKW